MEPEGSGATAALISVRQRRSDWLRFYCVKSAPEVDCLLIAGPERRRGGAADTHRDAAAARVGVERLRRRPNEAKRLMIHCADCWPTI